MTQHTWSDDQVATMSLIGFGSFIFLSILWVAMSINGNAESIELSEIGSDPKFLLGSAIVSLISFGGTVWKLGIIGHPLGWRAVGFRPTTLKWMSITAAIGTLFVPVSVVISLVVSNLLIHENSVDNSLSLPVEQFDTVPIFEYIVVFISIAIIVPIAEEIFFRGVLFKWLRTRTSFWVAAGISSIIFGAIHFSAASMVSLSLAGFLCALSYEHSKSLWTAIAIHAGNNGIIVIVYYFVFKTPIIL